MPFKVVYRLIQQAGDRLAGWGQGFWNNGSDLTALLPTVENLRARMAGILGIEAYIVSARISDPDNFRRVNNVKFAGAGPGGVGSVTESDYPVAALQLHLEAPGPYLSNQWLSGIPDSVIKTGGTYTPTGANGFTGRMNLFLSELLTGTNGWCIRGLNRAIPAKPVTLLAVQTGILTVPAHGFGAAGAVVNIRVSGFRVPAGVNRVWRATCLDGNTVQLNFYVPPTETVFPAGESPSARLQTYTYVPIQTTSIIRATSHYRGRPTGLLGGRQRRRRRSQVGQPVDV